MKLPIAFIEKYEKILGKKEFQEFLASFEEKPVSAYRLNPLKDLSVMANQDAEAIAGSPFGYYGKVAGKSANHVMGLVYSQEPAAQMVGAIADAKPGLKVLDLCAAPGGKSTQLLSSMDNQGLLVSNEISAKRSKILVENIERFGARNVIVLNESAENLAKIFPEFFDLIILDAPCSGEGMFRKDPSAIQYWNEDYPAQCSVLQKEIIDEAMKMLAPSGQLVYSTCTWSREENEDNISYMLEKYPNLSLVPLTHEFGLAEGINMSEVVRCWPHHFRGEGQFIAKLQNKTMDAPQILKHRLKNDKNKGKNANTVSSEQYKLWETFAFENLNIRFERQLLQVFGDYLYLLPAGLPDLGRLKIARNGLHLGTFKKNRFEPSFALGLALKPSEVKNKTEISDEEFVKYVAGESFKSSSECSGWTQLVIANNGLGFAKLVNGTVKNYFPKGLRFKI